MYAWVHEILPFSWEKIHGFYARPSMTRHLFYIDLHLEEHFLIDKFDTHMSATKQYFSSISIYVFENWSIF